MFIIVVKQFFAVQHFGQYNFCLQNVYYVCVNMSTVCYCDVG